MNEVYAYNAERYVISTKTTGGSHKVFQIVCSRKDGSLYVTFPYLKGVNGRLGKATLSSSLRYPTDFTFGEDFPVTTHNVKYSHHPDGRTHFSQDGKVKTTIKKESVRLSEANGHIFTIMVQGPKYFDLASNNEKTSNKRGFVNFPLECSPTSAIKFVAHYYPEKELASRVQSKTKSPWFVCSSPDGKLSPGILLNTSYTLNGERHFLMLLAQEVNEVSPGKDVFISLLGGFDPPSTALDHTKDTSFLMFIYPETGNMDELVKKFGTIDFQRNA